MVNSTNKENKIILTFPKPFATKCTPYGGTDFCNNTIKHVFSEYQACKVILLGDVSVGKTSIINRFSHHIYDTNYKATIGVDFQVEQFNILGTTFTLHIWDTAGQERFKSLAQSYYRGAHVIIVVFDLANYATLMHVKQWLNEALSVNNGLIPPLKFIVGSKKDLVSPATYENIETDMCKICAEVNAEYWAVSSKTGENVESLFYRIAALAFNEYIKRQEKSQHHRVLPTIISPNLLNGRPDECHKKSICSANKETCL